MTPEDRVVALFSAANPVADAGTLVTEIPTRARLDDIAQLSEAMQDTKPFLDLRAAENRRRNWLAGSAAAVIVLVVGAGIGLAMLRGGTDFAAGSPGAVIEEFYRAFPTDIELAGEVFADDAVLTDAPTPPSRREGITEITAWMRSETFIVRSIEITRIEVSGNTVTWDDQVTTLDGGVVDGIGHVAVVENGRIVMWDFGLWEFFG